MAIRLFGFSIGRDNGGDEEQPNKSFVVPAEEEADGAIIDSGYGVFGHYLDLEGSARSENDLINKYREASLNFEVDQAIDDIVNEAIVSDEVKPPVSINLDNLKQPDTIRDKINEEFMEVCRLMGFNSRGHDVFRKWYVDGRLFYHKVIDDKNPKKGIQELRPIDPRFIKKMRKVNKDKDQNSGVEVIKSITEYYLFNDTSAGIGSTGDGVKIAKDSIANVTSGIADQKGKVLSYLHKALKPMNQLRMIEDAIVIYRISRAPERRIFYIDVGNLPKMKAEQYLKGIMTRYRNKLVYDTSDGIIRDDRRHQAMLEDYWLPRREGGRGTEITTLPGGQNLGELEDIKYFQRKLYQSLHVPPSRLEQEPGGFQLGRAAEINRDELKFNKFVSRLRVRFNLLFLDVLKTQLLLKGVVTLNDWEMMKDQINFDYVRDSHFTELKDSEVLRDRLETLQNAESYIGKYYSNEWVRRNILQQNDDDIEMMNKQINQEKEQESEDEDEF